MHLRDRSRSFSLLTLFFLSLCCAASLFRGGLGAVQPTPDRETTSRPRRVPWTTSRITGSLEPPSPYRVERVFPKLAFNLPVVLTRAPATTRLFLAELDGRIYSFENDPAVDKADLCFDLRAAVPDVQRLLGLTFHPDFGRNRYCYVCYVLGEGLPNGSRVARYRVVEKDGVPRIDPASEQIVFQWSSGGHNAGCLKFGPDGMLYLTTGDGAEAFPPDSHHAGQSISDVRAAVLRLDVDHPEPGKTYAVPSDNPFVEYDGARGEIWAYGFRNPWKMSFDATTGDLWIGDVGWELWEMIYRVERGGNYGWSLVEGPQPVNTEYERGPTPILPPTVVHSHTESRSITGGHVYRGDRLAELDGAYLYGDFVTGKVWALRHDGQSVTSHEELADSPLSIICFGRDHRDEFYLVDYAGGIYRLERNEVRSANLAFPTRLSETGLFASVKDHVPAPGVVAYTINAEPWADGAVAQRLIALPGTSQLGVHSEENVWIGKIKGKWSFPSDAVLAKTISLPGGDGKTTSLRRLETQILHRDSDTWRGYTYLWNDDQTDATLAPAEGLNRVVNVPDPVSAEGQRQQSWHFASRAECVVCHTTRGGSIYGFVPDQLDHEHDGDDQLSRLAHEGLFAEPLTEATDPFPSPYDSSKPLEARARAYLHVNCSHCHLRGGGGTAAMDVRRQFPLEATNLLNERPTQGTFGIHSAKVVAPGDPYRSVLYYRMAKLGRGRMPYFGSYEVDRRGLQLLHDWIAGLPAEAEAESDGGSAKQIDGKEPAAAVDQALATTTGALRIVKKIDDGEFSEAVHDSIVAAGTTHDDVQIRDLFERYLPYEERSQQLGAVVSSAEILRLAGDTERGRKLFFQADALACKNCHKIGDEGGEVGPDLSEIGKKYSREKLLQTILEPSREIEAKYVTYLVETLSGRVHSGLLVERNNRHVVLRSADAKDVRIPTDEVDVIVPQQTSLMPELQLRDLTAEQVADLLEFLSSLK